MKTLNEQHNEDVDASLDEAPFIPSQVDEEDLVEKLQAENEAKAFKQAQKFLKKNQREMKRLNKHAQDALFEGNKEQYVYAIKKLRDMLRQPYTEDMIHDLWLTSNQQLRELVRQAVARQESNVE